MCRGEEILKPPSLHCSSCKCPQHLYSLDQCNTPGVGEKGLEHEDRGSANSMEFIMLARDCREILQGSNDTEQSISAFSASSVRSLHTVFQRGCETECPDWSDVTHYHAREQDGQHSTLLPCARPSAEMCHADMSSWNFSW